MRGLEREGDLLVPGHLAFPLEVAHAVLVDDDLLDLERLRGLVLGAGGQDEDRQGGEGGGEFHLNLLRKTVRL